MRVAQHIVRVATLFNIISRCYESCRRAWRESRFVNLHCAMKLFNGPYVQKMSYLRVLRVHLLAFRHSRVNGIKNFAH